MNLEALAPHYCPIMRRHRHFSMWREVIKEGILNKEVYYGGYRYSEDVVWALVGDMELPLPMSIKDRVRIVKLMTANLRKSLGAKD